MQIRDAVQADFDQITAIYNEVLTNSTAIYNDRPATVEERISWWRSRIAEDFPVLVHTPLPFAPPIPCPLSFTNRSHSQFPPSAPSNTTPTINLMILLANLTLSSSGPGTITPPPSFLPKPPPRKNQPSYSLMHARPGWTQPYLFEVDGAAAGYGSILVGGRGPERERFLNSLWLRIIALGSSIFSRD